MAALMLLAACGSKQAPPTPVSPATLGGAAWQLEDLVGRGVIDNSHVTLQFMADGKVAGSGGCNRYSGSVAFKGLQIKFTPMASTMMACVPALMDQETRYFDALTRADTVSYDKTGALLIGVKGEAKPLLFRRGE
jgi:putative lipoprotein